MECMVTLCMGEGEEGIDGEEGRILFSELCGQGGHFAAYDVRRR